MLEKQEQQQRQTAPEQQQQPPPPVQSQESNQRVMTISVEPHQPSIQQQEEAERVNRQEVDAEQRRQQDAIMSTNAIARAAGSALSVAVTPHRTESIDSTQASFSPREVPGNVNVPFYMVADALPKFTGSSTSNIRMWVNSVSEEAAVYGWSQQHTLIAAKKALDGLARDWLVNQRPMKSWDELRGKLLETFERRVTASDIHLAMNSRRRRPDEDLLTYVNIMEGLGAQVEMSQKEVHEYITRGVTGDDNLRMALRTASSRSEFMDLLQSRERDLQQRTGAHRKNDKSANNYKQHLKCFACNEKGHIVKNCPKVTLNKPALATQAAPVICYRCGRPNHKANACPNGASSRGPAGAAGAASAGNRRPAGPPPRINNIVDEEENSS